MVQIENCFTFGVKQNLKITENVKRAGLTLATHDKGDKASEHGNFYQLLGVSVVALVGEYENGDHRGGEGDSGNNQE